MLTILAWIPVGAVGLACLVVIGMLAWDHPYTAAWVFGALWFFWGAIHLVNHYDTNPNKDNW